MFDAATQPEKAERHQRRGDAGLEHDEERKPGGCDGEQPERPPGRPTLLVDRLLRWLTEQDVDGLGQRVVDVAEIA